MGSWGMPPLFARVKDHLENLHPFIIVHLFTFISTTLYASFYNYVVCFVQNLHEGWASGPYTNVGL